MSDDTKYKFEPGYLVMYEFAFKNKKTRKKIENSIEYHSFATEEEMQKGFEEYGNRMRAKLYKERNKVI